MKKIILILVAIFISISYSHSSEIGDYVYHFTILKVYDENFVKLSDADLNKVLNETRTILKEKFGDDVEFEIKGEVSVKEFIDNFLNRNGESFLKREREERFDIFKREDFKKLRKKLQEKYSNEQALPIHKEFLPKDLHKKIKTVDDFVNALEKVYLDNIEEIKNLKDKDNNPIFTKENIKYFSGFYWKGATSGEFKLTELCDIDRYSIGILEPEYDIYLTNAPIIDDFSLELPTMITGIIDGYWNYDIIFITTFPVLTDLKYFKKIKDTEDFEMKLELLPCLFAHHIARKMTNIYSSYVDFLDGCLVDISPKKLKLEDRYETIIKTGTCQRKMVRDCLQENKKVKIAEQYILQGKYQEAIDIYKDLKENFFLRYLACLYEKVNKIEEAISAWEKYLELEKDSWIVERINKHIQELKELSGRREKRGDFKEKLNLKFFKKEFLSVFEKMVDYYWDESGDIKGDMMGDATGFAPYVLYKIGKDTKIEEFTQMADKVVNYAVELFKEVMPYIKEQKPHKNLLLAVSGTPALLDGYKYTGKKEYLDMIKEGLSASTEIAYNNPAYFTFFFDIPNVVEALVSYSNFLIYKETKEENFLKSGLKLFEKIDKTWNEEKGYYGKRIKVNFDWMQGLVFLNLGLLYDITKDLKYKERADRMIESLDRIMWDEERGGYFSSDKKLNETKSLSGNAIFIMGYLNLYEATGEVKYFEKAKKILEFLFTEDFYRDGIIYHDWDKKYGRSNSFCTGCNYLILSNIYRLNELSKNKF